VFISATKMACVTALLSLFEETSDSISPRSITVEYPDEELQWPSIFVRFNPQGTVRWTGLNPDEYVTEEGDARWTQLRHGYFEGSYALTILALSSAERDRLYDKLIEVILMGELTEITDTFRQTLMTDNLIGITINPSQVILQGQSESVGVPWDGDSLAYEATLGFNVVGEFYTDIHAQQLISLSDVQVFFTDPSEVDTTDTDGHGPWETAL
jgi:hypothetical protein